MNRIAKPFILCAFFLVCVRGLAFDLVEVPTGKLDQFWLTPVSEKNKQSRVSNRKITVEKFLLMSHAVTVEQYRKFLDQNPKWLKENASRLFIDETYLDQAVLATASAKSPITNVSWFAAQAFCKSLQMRLPTVNEWEYAAAASDKIKDANREEKFLRRILDWYGEPRDAQLKNVGSIYKNIYGIWDMHGLIWEWVYDFNSSFVTGESREDSSFNKNLFCGAGAMSGSDKENYAAFMRFAFRSSLKGRSSAWNLGFRCAR